MPIVPAGSEDSTQIEIPDNKPSTGVAKGRDSRDNHFRLPAAK